jgi:hypothetical protein
MTISSQAIDPVRVKINRDANREPEACSAAKAIGLLLMVLICLAMVPCAIAAQDQSQIESEVQDVLRQCKGALQYSMYHDCDCIAARFKEARPLHMEREVKAPDPAQPGKFRTQMVEIPTWEVTSMIKNQCLNKDGIVKYHYDNCTRMMSRRRDDFETYCGCVSRDIAEAYIEKPDQNLNSIYINKLTVAAYGRCEPAR